MIHESYYWKKPLLDSAKYLEELRVNKKNQERSCIAVEKALFTGFYAIRKLLDTYKVTDKAKAKSFVLKWFPLKANKPGDYLNWHRISEHYDLKSSASETRDIRFICDQFIHSFIFIQVFTKARKISGFFISSDRARYKKLYFIELRQVLSAFRIIGRDDPRKMHFVRDPQNGQFDCAVS
jgi:hypothetical protein